LPRYSVKFVYEIEFEASDKEEAIERFWSYFGDAYADGDFGYDEYIETKELPS